MRARTIAVSLALAGAAAVAIVGACGSGSSQSFGPPPPAGDSGADQGGPVSCPGSTLCGGTCVDTTTDPANCGGCGHACTGGGLCCGGVCVVTAACSFAVTKTTPARGNQNGGDFIKLAGNGFVQGMQVFIGDGAAPTRMLDAHNAIIQTPPAPVGVYDVKVVAGGMIATLHGGFQYVVGGLQQPWQKKPMSVVRGEDPALAVLQDGRVLIAGGTLVPDDATMAVNTAEIYTRSTDTVTLAANKMSITRWHDSATTMLTGKALVAGGAAASTSADLFDPATNMFSPTKSAMNTARFYMRSVLLLDGRVLLTSRDVQTAEIYDPDMDSFTQIPTLGIHSFGFIVRLRDGRVLLGGGDGGVTTCEIYDPATGAFKAAASLLQGRSMLTAHTLPNGHVMVIGGSTMSAGAVDAPLDEIELYDPKTDMWTVAPYKLSTPRTWHASALVRDGTILVMGGYNVDKSCAPTNTVDQVDPVMGKVTAFATLPNPNTEWTAVTLLDGSVLGVGGGACGTPTALPDIDFLPGATNQ
jgi:hypothetical protein